MASKLGLEMKIEQEGAKLECQELIQNITKPKSNR